MKLSISGVGEVFFTTNGDTRQMIIPPATSNILIEGISYKAPSIEANELGIYRTGSFGREGKLQFTTLSGPKHLIQSRGDKGCYWRPKGGFGMSTSSIDSCPVKINAEICPDELWNSCFEQMLGTGTDIHDLRSTPESRRLLSVMLNQIYRSIGNDLHAVSWYGNHPYVTQSYENGWYSVPLSEMEDFVDQQNSCVGYYTLIDELKAQGNPNFNVEISASDVDGWKYTGDAQGLFDELILNTSNIFAHALNGLVDGIRKPLILVSKGIFYRYKYQLQTQYNCIPEMCQLRVTGFNGGQPFPNVLIYNGIYIYYNSMLDYYDSLLGIISHRAIFTVPGQFGFGYDTPSLNQFDGLGKGLVIYQSFAPRDLGAMYIYSNMRMATALTQPDFIRSASLILTPPSSPVIN